MAPLLYFCNDSLRKNSCSFEFFHRYKEYAFLLQSCDCKTVFTSKAFIDVADLHNLVKALEDVGIKIVYMESLRKSINSHNKFSGLLKSYFPLFYHNRYAISKGISATSPAAVLFTSGSEGAPKGVVLSHKNIISNLQQVVSRIDISSSDRLFNALPMFHSFGLTAGTIMPLLSGVFTFLYPSLYIIGSYQR